MLGKIESWSENEDIIRKEIGGRKNVKDQETLLASIQASFAREKGLDKFCCNSTSSPCFFLYKNSNETLIMFVLRQYQEFQEVVFKEFFQSTTNKFHFWFFWKLFSLQHFCNHLESTSWFFLLTYCCFFGGSRKMDAPNRIPHQADHIQVWW